MRRELDLNANPVESGGFERFNYGVVTVDRMVLD